MVEELVIIELEFELAMLSVLSSSSMNSGVVMVEVDSASKWSEAQFEMKWN